MTTQRTCAVCSAKLTGRPESVYCSSACRQKAYRERTRNVIDELKRQTGQTTRNVTPEAGSKRKQATRNVTPEPEVIDWESLPPKVREREAVMRRVIRKEIEREYKLLLEAEKALRFQAEVRAARAGSMERNVKRVLDTRGGAVFSSADYALIRKCLHPDTRNGGGVSEQNLTKAFRLINEAKLLLCKEQDSPRRKAR